MHKALHARDDVDRLYISRKERGKFASIDDSVDTSIQFENYVEESGGRLITVTRNNTENTGINRRKIARKHTWKDKQLYESFKCQTSDISLEKT